MAKRATVPKFGTWDKDNVGYTIYFDKVRENKGGATTAPPLQHRPYNPNDPEDGPLRAVQPPSSRPSTAGGRPNNGQAHHQRAGSSSSEPGGSRGAAEQSKFAPPPQYYQRPSPQHQQPAQSQNPYHGGGGHRHHHPSPPGHGGGGHRGQQAPRHQHQQHYHHQAPGPRARSASPQNNAPRQRPSAAVPKFGVWDEQSAASAAQGFTVQFERVKRDRDVARAGGVPDVPRPPPPPEPRRSHRDSPFFSKMFGCFRPTDRY
ncbi:hypothetical protein QOZ80_6BG0499240 [Eleusine coracana subsp. coracana]|nr:hypothetical protein QOZ80_6BG0499240 [Eleusine coracana subsp. coracana]